MVRRWCLGLVLCAACGAGSATPAAPAGPPAPRTERAGEARRPTIEECKAAADHVVEITLLAFDDDPAFRAEIMGEVREREPGPREDRCHAEATTDQVACLAALADVGAIAACAPPVDGCVRAQRQDPGTCEQMEREWGWGADLLASALEQ